VLRGLFINLPSVPKEASSTHIKALKSNPPTFPDKLDKIFPLTWNFTKFP
jgi:hypothetical protein